MSESLNRVIQEANNLETPPLRLEEIYQNYPQPEINRAIVSNPNTPPAVLWELGVHFPRELLANPVLELMFLENPNFLADLPEATLISLLRRPELEESYVILLLNHRRERDVLVVIISRHTQLWNNWRQNNLDVEIELGCGDPLYFDPQDANFRGANLTGVDLTGVDLAVVDLRGANLRGADLRGAKLEFAYLENADLRGADLRGAHLGAARLNDQTQIEAKWLLVWDIASNPTSDRDLRGADLRDAHLEGADLRGAYLENANLRGANLRRADLRWAYLWGAHLEDANLEGADLTGAKLPAE